MNSSQVLAPFLPLFIFECTPVLGGGALLCELGYIHAIQTDALSSALSREEAQGILVLANEMGSTRRLYQYTNVAVINCRVLSSSTTEAHHLSLLEDRSPRPKA